MKKPGDLETPKMIVFAVAESGRQKMASFPNAASTRRQHERRVDQAQQRQYPDCYHPEPQQPNLFV